MNNKYKELISEFSNIDGISTKQAEKIVLEIINSSETKNKLIESINDSRNLKKCKECNKITIDDVCLLCENLEEVETLYLFFNNSDFSQIIVSSPFIETPSFIFGSHDDIDKLKNFIIKHKTQEVILMIERSIENNVLASELVHKLDSKKIKWFFLATGIPYGHSIKYVDSITLKSAISNKEEFNGK